MGPLHQRIRAEIEARIRSGEWAPGHRAPTEAELMAQYACSRMTVNKAMTALVEAGLIAPFFPIMATSLSGYTGGGKSMIAEFESGEGHERVYATGLMHKHLPEMTLYSGLESPPIFSPKVGRFPQGLIVEVPLPLWALPDAPDLETVHDALMAAYDGERFVNVASLEESRATGSVDADSLANTNQLLIHVFGDPEAETANLVAVFDNLGKGASGAAVQNLNLVLGVDEGLGL